MPQSQTTDQPTALQALRGRDTSNSNRMYIYYKIREFISRNDEHTLISWTSILPHKALVVMCSLCIIQMIGHEVRVILRVRGEGCNTLSHEGLANVNIRKRMLYRHFVIYLMSVYYRNLTCFNR